MAANPYVPAGFDPKAPEWAVDPAKFPADKEEKWGYPPEKDGWILSHNSLRGELDDFQAALSATLARLNGTAPSEWEVAAIKKWYKAHADHMHSHHENEDALMVPYLRERVKIPQKVEKDHEVLIAHMAKIEKIIAGLSTGDKSGVPALAQAWEAYTKDVKPHLLEEEGTSVPLMRAFFEQAEIGKKVGEILGNEKAPKEELGSFIYYTGEDTFRNEFMVQEGIPFFVWWVGGFESKFKYYRDEVAVLITALKEGKEQAPKEWYEGCTIL